MTPISTLRTSALRTTLPSNDKALITKIKSTYEQVVKKKGGAFFPNEKKGSAKDLKGDALAAYREYASTAKAGLINEGGPRIKVGTLNGQKIFYVSGDVSDTGSQHGFYNAQGKLLAQAYTGQGQKSNANGVDWMK